MKKTFISIGAFLVPFIVQAAEPAPIKNTGGNLTNFVVYMGQIINVLVPLVSTLAVVYFFYGLAKYILNSEDEDKRKEGKDIMIWGILAMFVIGTIWGIIGFIQATIGNTGAPTAGTIVTPDIHPTGVVGGTPY